MPSVIGFLSSSIVLPPERWCVNTHGAILGQYLPPVGGTSYPGPVRSSEIRVFEDEGAVNERHSVRLESQ